MENRGGKRAGSGRKAVKPGDKRVSMVLSVAPDTKQRLKAICQERNIPVGRFIEELLAKVTQSE